MNLRHSTLSQKLCVEIIKNSIVEKVCFTRTFTNWLLFSFFKLMPDIQVTQIKEILLYWKLKIKVFS